MLARVAAFGALALLALFPHPLLAVPPNVLLMTVDTLRPDALGWVGGGQSTPAFDRLAKEGFRFPSAVSPAPLTLPAHASMMTGLLPPRHGVRDNGQTLSSSVPTLAERLQQGGYSTAAFVSGFPLEERFGLARGFAHYDDELPEVERGRLERRAPDTVKAALEWLQGARAPWFVWIHFYDPHDPYEPPREFWRPGARGRYDGEVAFTDFAAGELLTGFKDASAKPFLTVMTADHGEALGEHEEERHGYFIYDSTILVPLVFHFPGRVRPGESASPARLVDLVPTVLELIQQAPMEDLDGLSLAPTLHGKPQNLGAAYVETWLPWTYFGWAPLRGLRSKRFKLVVAPRPELYDLVNDPGEEHNVIDSERPTARRMIDTLRELEARRPARLADAAGAEASEGLRALGYIGAGGTREPPKTASLADPKDRIPLRRLLLEAESLLGAGRSGAALGLFEKVLEEEPSNRLAWLRGGAALRQAGAFERAETWLIRAVELDPERGEARFALADVMSQLGKHARAAEQWKETVRLQPERAEVWLSLAKALSSSGRRKEALRAIRQWLERAGREDAGYGLGRLELAKILTAAGETAEARQSLSKTLRDFPDLKDVAASDPGLAALLEN